ncbi:MAG: hypothetical protein CMJ06_04535 [Pelagibacterales bacterium]|nr:hypothetical protein [Pelagibacterales bacterium]OUU61977.1 MAG: hypothetical protein CBC22_05985 [Alphaproteobacteria bacterium TMED62]|tara:strand:- start:3281 stop:4165 length:885 start_codon:yes stop_codon:yes gene_type:complete
MSNRIIFSLIMFLSVILFFSGCGKYSTVKDIVQGVYDSSEKNKRYKSKNIKILTGDTIHSLSKKYRITVKEIIRFNKIKPPFILKPGKFIKIPASKIYKIKKGDTFYKIAKCNSVYIKDIKEKNINLNEKKLIIGAKIFLPYYAVNNCNFKNQDRKKQKKNKSYNIKSKEIFSWPVKGKIVTNFGKQTGGRMNDGINLISAKGNPVRAALNGKVIYIGNELLAWGNLIIIKHKNNWTTAYAHLDKFLVQKGEIVKTGDIIGSIGSTGNVVKSQLHFQVRKKSKPLNPINFLKKQ